MLDLSEFNDLYAESKNKIWNIFDGWLKEGSGWIITSLDEFILKICKYTPIMGSSYIKSPKKIENTKYVVNIQNEDNKCFLWSILAALHPVERHTERTSNYEPYIDELKTDGITMPMRLQQIPKFEKIIILQSMSTQQIELEKKNGQSTFQNQEVKIQLISCYYHKEKTYTIHGSKTLMAYFTSYSYGHYKIKK